jgi:hypothetical protein
MCHDHFLIVRTQRLDAGGHGTIEADSGTPQH